jgi:hypothetical protein
MLVVAGTLTTRLSAADTRTSPATVEWTYWTWGGASWVTRASEGLSAGAAVGVGTEATVSVLRYPGFPSSPTYGRANGDAEVRAGAWLLAGTRAAGAFAEGGLKVHLGAVYHASWGTFDLRVGAGYGAFGPDRADHASISFVYGIRSVVERYQWGVGPLPPPPSVAEASVARLFATYRHSIDRPNVSELVIGVELSPTFFLPPVTWFRIGGGPPI